MEIKSNPTEKWRCNTCSMTSNRKWNVERHISSYHMGYGAPILQKGHTGTFQNAYGLMPTGTGTTKGLFDYNYGSILSLAGQHQHKKKQHPDSLDFLDQLRSKFLNAISERLVKDVIDYLFNRPIMQPVFPQPSNSLNIQNEVFGYEISHCSKCRVVEALQVLYSHTSGPIVRVAHKCGFISSGAIKLPDGSNETQKSLASLAATAGALIGAGGINNATLIGFEIHPLHNGKITLSHPHRTDQSITLTLQPAKWCLDIGKISSIPWLARVLHERQTKLSMGELSEFLLLAQDKTFMPFDIKNADGITKHYLLACTGFNL